MADDERQDEKSLELPSVSSAFRRRKRKSQQPEAEPEPAAVASASPVARTEAHSASRTAPAGQPGRRLSRLAIRLPRPSRVRRPHRVHVPGPLAALVTGALVGLVVVGLTTLSLRVCSSVRGTSSCGKPGILLLLAITVVAVFLGSLLLRASGVAAHGSTSFLGVGLLVVLILLALLPVLDEWWVVIVVPLVAMLTYLASWWITTTYVEPGERPR